MPKNPTWPELEGARARWRYAPPTDLLAGRVVLVTGAGDGIGRVAAMVYAAYGANVVLLGRTRSKLDRVHDWIVAETATDPSIVPCDLEAMTPEAAGALAESISGHYGRLHGVLHNASLLGPRVPLVHYDPAMFQRVMRVNVEAEFLITRALLPLLDGADDASVIFTSSGVGRRGRAYWGAYSVSKFATEGLAEVLADEHEEAGRIRVNIVNPGGTRTAMRQAAYPAENPATLPVPEQHMDLYLYLMGRDSRGVTGERFDAASWEPG